MTEDRTLTTTLPDGTRVVTEPDERRPWRIHAQCAQADDHRREVRLLLTSRGAARLLTTERNT